MTAAEKKKLLHFLLKAGLAFRRKGLLGFLFAPVLLEPFIEPLFAEFRREHQKFMEENFPSKASATEISATEERPLH